MCNVSYLLLTKIRLYEALLQKPFSTNCGTANVVSINEVDPLSYFFYSLAKPCLEALDAILDEEEGESEEEDDDEGEEVQDEGDGEEESNDDEELQKFNRGC